MALCDKTAPVTKPNRRWLPQLVSRIVAQADLRDSEQQIRKSQKETSQNDAGTRLAPDTQLLVSRWPQPSTRTISAIFTQASSQISSSQKAFRVVLTEYLLYLCVQLRGKDWLKFHLIRYEIPWAMSKERLISLMKRLWNCAKPEIGEELIWIPRILLQKPPSGTPRRRLLFHFMSDGPAGARALLVYNCKTAAGHKDSSKPFKAFVPHLVWELLIAKAYGWGKTGSRQVVP